MLAACGDKGCSRDKLVGLVWPEREEENAKHLLATAVYVLRSTLGEEAVLTTGEYLRLNPDIVRSDVQMFAEALEGVRLDEAVGTYGGPFLEGFYLKEAPEFERWVESERQRLADAHADALDRLADRAEAAGDFRRAVDWWRRLIACDPYNTRVALRLLQAMAESGDRANALQYAQEHERLLRDDLGMEPDPQLVALAERLRVEPARVSEGVKATTADPALITVDEAGSEAAPRRRLLSWRNAGLSFVAALAMWGVVATGRMMFGERGAASEAERQSIAVLPFVNLSREEATEPFTDGIHDDILIHLYKIADLKVISRTSVMEYRDTRKNLRQIADELGVATILEGGVQRTGDRVRINVELIDAETDEHLWAETYEEDLTAENVFAIQTAIAQHIASALKAQLTPEESERIAARPTENLEAYEHYVRGGAYYRRGRAAPQWHEERLPLEDSAIAEYERAVELDPEFSAAWAALARVRNSVFFSFPFWYPEEREKAEQALARAVVLAPESFETHVAQAHYYKTVGEDPARAMGHLTLAETLRPNDTEVLRQIAGVLRFQGKWEEALTYNERAVELDPQNTGGVRSLADTYQRMRRFAEAERYWDRAIALDPSSGRPYGQKFRLYVWGLGDTVKARVFAEQHPDRKGFQARLHYVRRDYEHALDLLRSHFPEAWAAIIYPFYLTSRLAETRAYADSVAREWRRETETSSERLTAAQLSWRRSFQGLAYAFAGEIEAAIREGEEALELYPVATDQFNYFIIVQNVCDIYVLAGEHDLAIDQLELLLSTPTRITTAWLRLDPFYDPLRDHPRFQALLAKYEQ